MITIKILNASIIPQIYVLFKSFFFYWKLVASSEHYQNLSQKAVSYFVAHILGSQILKCLVCPIFPSYFKKDALDHSEFHDCSILIMLILETIMFNG